MKKIIIILASFFFFFSFFLPVNASSNSIFGNGNVDIPYCDGDNCGIKQGADYVGSSGIDGLITEGKASDYIQKILVYLLTFLKLAAVIVIIYAGFNILTAAGDEDKFKTSKNIMIYAVIGLAIIYLAGPITNFIIDVFTKS